MFLVVDGKKGVVSISLLIFCEFILHDLLTDIARVKLVNMVAKRASRDPHRPFKILQIQNLAVEAEAVLAVYDGVIAASFVDFEQVEVSEL